MDQRKLKYIQLMFAAECVSRGARYGFVITVIAVALLIGVEGGFGFMILVRL